MEIPDVEVFRTIKEVAGMKPLMKKVAELMDNGGLDKKIEKAVEVGITNCPYYVESAANKKILGFVKWIIVVIVPLVTTLLTIEFTVGFSK